MYIYLFKYIKFAILYLFILHSIIVAQSDSSSIRARLVEPKRASVYTGNTINFLVDIQDPELNIKTIQYYIIRPLAVMGKEWIRKDSLLAEVSNPPYQFIWNCTDFPSMPALNFYAIVIDKDGNKIKTNIVSEIVIDRHVEFTTLTIKAPFVKYPLICDGNLNEPFWNKIAEPACFPNGNNRIKFLTGWNKQNLYIGITIWDTQLFTCFDTSYSTEFLNDNPMFKIYYSDFLAVYLDPLNKKSSFRQENECEVRISPIGHICWRTTERNKKFKGTNLGTSKIYGTLNNSSDEDSLWVVELALPWKIIGIKPKSNHVLGFDVYNVDREDSLLHRITSLWSGGGALYVKNPSEWANLLLLPKKDTKLSYFYLAALLVPLFFVFVFIRIRGIKSLYFSRRTSILVLSRKQYVCKQIDSYLEAHFQDETLNMDELSKKLRFSKEYLTKCYKGENRRSISKKLIQLRIDKAKELMGNSANNITEIAFAVGFNSLEVFIRNFKRLEGVTPSQYKKEKNNHYS